MCGLIGFWKREYNFSDYEFINKSIESLFLLTETRGQDTAGIAIKNGKSQKKGLFKRNNSASKMIKEKEYIEFVKSYLLEESVNSLSQNGFISILGHCRMETNGRNDIEYNNQPVYKEGNVCVHNGIIVNIETLWQKSMNINERRFEIDSEIICDYFNYGYKYLGQYGDTLKKIFSEIYGETTIGYMPADHNDLIFATNTGSAYYIYNNVDGIFVFASEKFILEEYIKSFGKYFDQFVINKLMPNEAIVIDEVSGKLTISSIDDLVADYNKSTDEYKFIVDSKTSLRDVRYKENVLSDEEKSMLEYDYEGLKRIKRCTRCLLPASFPFIHYDNEGVCNYCHAYQNYSPKSKGDLLDEFKKKVGDKSVEVLLTFSGGRDSSYGLHVLNEMGINVVTYTYDWGMVTDLARRNQSRMCGKLGIEHIIVAADINKKRRNIQKNVKAWLKRPSLGTVPLFMAGDKHYFYYANKVMQQNEFGNIIVLCDNPLEVTYFKFGFAGVKPNFEKKRQLFTISLLSQLKMLGYYIKEFLLNPRYINSSLVDTIKGYISYYGINHDYINLYKFIEWDEKVIEKVLIENYDWELSPDSESTWRIGDGTAPFYNYIYTTVAGFSENDTFRSNQIREGVLTREEALELVLRDNKPRYESIKWYLDTIGVDFKYAIEQINKIKKLY